MTRNIRYDAVASTILSVLLVLVAQVQHHTVIAQECNAEGICDQHESCRFWQQAGECRKNKDYMLKRCPVACHQDCSDRHPRCPVWASLRECEENPQEMQEHCPQSCGICSPCVDGHENCPVWANRGECQNNEHYMSANCAKSCSTCHAPTTKRKGTPIEDYGSELLDWTSTVGVRQTAAGSDGNNTLSVIKASKDYLERAAAAEELPPDILENCINREALCSFWAYSGECLNNPPYMTVNCAPACRSCHVLLVGKLKRSAQNNKNSSNLCRPDEPHKAALRPGTLNKLFERIVTASSYSTTVLSRPSEDPATEVNVVVDKSMPPWMIMMDDFMTPEECEIMLRERDDGLQNLKIAGGGNSNADPLSAPEAFLCSIESGCRGGDIEDIPGRLYKRISQTFQIPTNNIESFQILRYKNTNQYNSTTRHDYIPDEEEKKGGPRILSFVLFLSDAQQHHGGGETVFPQLDVTVRPQQGRALVWPNVYNSDPRKRDPRLIHHQALPAEVQGTHSVMNGWIHLYDIVTPQTNGCI